MRCDRPCLQRRRLAVSANQESAVLTPRDIGKLRGQRLGFDPVDDERGVFFRENEGRSF